MAKNPKRALEAVTAAGERVDGILVREITLGIAAVLEAIGSPLVTGRKPETLRDMVPSIFVMTRPAVESETLLAGGPQALTAAAVEWADALTTDQGVRLAAACGRAAARLSRTAPQGVPAKTGAAEGNGSAAGTGG